MTCHTCSVPDCECVRYARGLCVAHYQRLTRTGNLRPLEPIAARTTPLCAVRGCWRSARKTGLCPAHARKSPVRPALRALSAARPPMEAS